MIKLQDAFKIYNKGQPNEVIALNHITLTLPETGFILVYGTSGSGKSTFLNCISNLDQLDSGTISYSKPIKNSFIFQEFQLINEMTVYDNLKLVLEINHMTGDIDSILDRLGILKFKNHKANQLSGGQKQRVAIARAILLDHALIIADEPTGSLDKKNSQEIANILHELSKEKLVIVASHDFDLFKEFADQIMKFEDGAITEHEIKRVSEKTNDCTIKKDPKLEIKTALKIDMKNFKKSKLKVFFSVFTLFLGFVLILISSNLVFNNNYQTLYHYLDEYGITYVDFFSYNKKTGEEEIQYQSIEKSKKERLLNKYKATEVKYNESGFMFYATNLFDEKKSFDTITRIQVCSSVEKTTLHDNEIAITSYFAGILAKELYNSDLATVMLGKTLTFANIDFNIVKIVGTNPPKRRLYQLLTAYTEKECQTVWMTQHDFQLSEQYMDSRYQIYFLYQEKQSYIWFYNENPIDEDTIEYGTSTLNQGEIILSKSDCKKIFNTDDYQSLISQDFIFDVRKTYRDSYETKSYKIVGISTKHTYLNETDSLELYMRFSGMSIHEFTISGIRVYQPSIATLKELIQKEHLRHDVFISYSYYSSVHTLQNFALVFLILGMIMLIVNFLVLANYINSSIENKKREIGILKSFYVSLKDISKLFLIEILIISLFSFVISSVALIPLLYLFNNLLEQKQLILMDFINYNALVNLVILLLLMIVVVVYNFLSIRKLKKKSTIDLIYER